MEVPDIPACRAASPSTRLSGAEAPPSRVNTPCASGLTPAALRAGNDLPSGWPWTSSPQGALRVKVQIPCQPPTGLCFKLSNFRGAEYKHQPPPPTASCNLCTQGSHWSGLEDGPSRPATLKLQHLRWMPWAQRGRTGLAVPIFTPFISEHPPPGSGITSGYRHHPRAQTPPVPSCLWAVTDTQVC